MTEFPPPPPPPIGLLQCGTSSSQFFLLMTLAFYSIVNASQASFVFLTPCLIVIVHAVLAKHSSSKNIMIVSLWVHKSVSLQTSTCKDVQLP